MDPGTLPREVCQRLGLIVVELVTNTAKHAFIGRTNGRVSVSLRRRRGGWICVVADDGGGLRGGPGEGMSFVRGLARAMDGELAIRSGRGGTVATVSLPVEPSSGAARLPAASRV